MAEMKTLRHITANDIPARLTSVYEEGAVTELDEFIWVWEHPSVFYLTFSASINFADIDYALSNSYAVNRSAVFGGKSTSAILAGTDIGILSKVSKDEMTSDDFIEKYYFSAWKYVASQYGVELESSGNDLIVKGTDKKICGTIYKEDDLYYYGHCSFIVDRPDIDFDVLFKLPIEKFEGKTVNSASERIVALSELTNETVTKEAVMSHFVDYLVSNGIVLVQENFTEQEKSEIEKLEQKHLHNDWIKYGRITREPDFI